MQFDPGSNEESSSQPHRLIGTFPAIVVEFSLKAKYRSLGNGEENRRQLHPTSKFPRSNGFSEIRVSTMLKKKPEANGLGVATEWRANTMPVTDANVDRKCAVAENDDSRKANMNKQMLTSKYSLISSLRRPECMHIHAIQYSTINRVYILSCMKRESEIRDTVVSLPQKATVMAEFRSLN